MGFFSTLIHTASSIVGFVVDNAGSIAKVASTIAEFLPPVAVDAEIDTLEDLDDAGDTNATTTLFRSFEKVESAMFATAAKLFPAPVPTTSATVSGPYQLTSLWPHPPSQASEIPPVVAGDVHKFLALRGLPSVLRTKSNTPSIDVGNEIARQMFAHPDSALRAAADGAKRSFIYNPISIGPFPANEGTSITGGYLWYAIPMGNVDEEGNAGHDGHVSWHSILYFWVVMPLQARNELRERKEQLAVLPTNSVHLRSGLYNVTTIRVTWTGASSQIQDLMTKAVKAVKKNPKKITLTEPPALTGVTYTYQFSSPIMVGPGAVSAALSSAISNELADLPPSPVNLHLMPDVTVVQMQCLMGNPNITPSGWAPTS